MADPQGNPTDPYQSVPVAPAGDTQRPSVPATPPPSSTPPERSTGFEYFEKQLEQLVDSFAENSEKLEKVRKKLEGVDETLEVSEKELAQYTDKQSEEYKIALLYHQEYVREAAKLHEEEQEVGRKAVQARAEYHTTIKQIESLSNKQYEDAKKFNASLGEMDGAVRVMTKTTIEQAAKTRTAFHGLTENLKASNEAAKNAKIAHEAAAEKAKADAEAQKEPVDFAKIENLGERLAAITGAIETSKQVSDTEKKKAEEARKQAEILKSSIESIKEQIGTETSPELKQKLEQDLANQIKQLEALDKIQASAEKTVETEKTKIEKLEGDKKSLERQQAVTVAKQNVFKGAGDADINQLSVFKAVNSGLEKLIDVSALNLDEQKKQFAEMMMDEKEREKTTIAISDSIRSEMESSEKSLEELVKKSKSPEGFGGPLARREANIRMEQLRSSIDNSKKVLEKIQKGGIESQAAIEGLMDIQLAMSDEQRKKNIKDMEANAEREAKGVPKELVGIFQTVDQMRGLLKDFIPKLDGRGGILKAIFMFLAFTLGAWIASVWARLTTWFAVTKRIIPFMEKISEVVMNLGPKIMGVLKTLFGGALIKFAGWLAPVMKVLQPVINIAKYIGVFFGGGGIGFFNILTKAFGFGFRLISKLPFIGWIISGIIAIMDIFKVFKVLGDGGTWGGFFKTLAKGVVVALINFLTLGFLDFKKVLGFVNYLFDDLPGIIWNSIEKTMNGVADWMWSWISTIGTEVSMFFEKWFVDFPISVMKTVSETVGRIGDWMWSWVETTFTEISNLIAPIFAPVTNAVKGATMAFDGVMNWLSNSWIGKMLGTKKNGGKEEEYEFESTSMVNGVVTSQVSTKSSGDISISSNNSSDAEAVNMYSKVRALYSSGWMSNESKLKYGLNMLNMAQSLTKDESLKNNIKILRDEIGNTLDLENGRRIGKSSPTNVVGQATAQYSGAKAQQQAATATTNTPVVANNTTVVNRSSNTTQVTSSPSRYNPEPTLRGTQMAALPGVV